MPALSDATMLTSGSESDVYCLSVDSQLMILKSRHPQGHQQYVFEAFATGQAATQGAKVPHVLYVDDDALLLTKLPGAEMDDRPELFDDAPLFSALSNDLAAVHQIPMQGFGSVVGRDEFRGEFEDWQAFLASSAAMLTTIEPVGSLDQTDLQVLSDFWHAQAPQIALPQASLVHGDYAMSAIFVDDTWRYTGTIDFGDALAGDPLMDLAYFRYKEITKTYGPAVYKHLRTAYSRASQRQWSDQNDRAVLLYMIYWGVQRLHYCPDKTLLPKFGDKLHLVAKLIRANQYEYSK